MSCGIPVNLSFEIAKDVMERKRGGNDKIVII
jgi:hypothetical protein